MSGKSPSRFVCAVVWDRSHLRLAQLKEQPAAREGKPRLSGTQQILQSRHQRAPEADGSFQFFNLVPVEPELSISLVLRSSDGSEEDWSKALRIPIELGKLPVDPQERGTVPVQCVLRQPTLAASATWATLPASQFPSGPRPELYRVGMPSRERSRSNHTRARP
jgi:hypothetical protein